MVTLGYALSSEEQPPSALVENAALAESVGFEFASISDHFHPWISTQGNSPFVWGVLGGISEATDSLQVGTGVTCPTIRMHPAIVAHAAATAAVMLEDRFFLGVGTGENLNEHVVGDRWPPFAVRSSMLEEAVDVIRQLLTDGDVSHYGRHFTVENARLYTAPDDPPPIYVAASGETMAAESSRYGDGLISTAPDADLVEAFRQPATDEAPRIGQLTVCWAEDEAEARRTAVEWWPNTALPGQLGQDLPTPAHFEQAGELVDEADVADRVICGPDIGRHVDGIQEFLDAGFDHVYVHQVGPEQRPFFEAYEADVFPSFD